MFSKHVLFITLCFQLYSVLSITPCTSRDTCEECIKDINVCVWCVRSDFNETRCRPQTPGKNLWCQGFLENPENKAEPASYKDFNTTRGHVIQIKPQSFKMKLRPGKPRNFNFSFRGAKDLPVDLYFLLDASNTMSTIKNKTAAESYNIYQTLRNLTSDVTLGLGTFVDKGLYPYIRKFDSENTYSYKHRLKLTKDFKKFEQMVANNPNGVNRDFPEGGLDALAQAMTCEEVVGWRKESRKIIVFLTDASYHVAGDGKSAGLFQPYDGKCYTNNNTFTYQNEVLMDYPSVGMINKLASERDIIIIFFVDSNFRSLYEELSTAIRGSSVTTFESNASKKQDSSIVQILSDAYKKITKKIKLKVSNKSGKRKNFEISFKPNCTTDNSITDCDVKIGTEQHFNATIKLLQYDDLPNNIIDISVEGFNEKLTLDVEFIKNCDCASKLETNSSFCSGDVQKCGVCECSGNRYGKRCECKKNGDNTGVYDNSTCIANGSNMTCSGRGPCICGSCICAEGYDGSFCECNYLACKTGDNFCNNHGNCECGKCACRDEWSGDLCQCTTSTDTCEVTIRNTTRICNNRGTCVCGSCECDPIAKWDVRRKHDAHCAMQPCTDCHELQCSGLENCVMCKFNDGECSLDQCPGSINTTLVQTLPKEYLNSTEWKLCNEIRVKVGCYARFVYRYNEEDYGIVIVVQEKLNCQENYLIYGGICLGTLLLVGLCTLVGWKLLTEARDRREFNDFKKKHGDDGLLEHSNPLYTPPSTKVRNPLFRQPSIDARVG